VGHPENWESSSQTPKRNLAKIGLAPILGSMSQSFTTVPELESGSLKEVHSCFGGYGEVVRGHPVNP